MSLAKRLLGGKASAFGGAMGGNRATNRARSRSARSAATTSRRGGKMNMVMTGWEELDKKLLEIASENGPKSINARMRKLTREAVKKFVYPLVLAAIPDDTGFLKSMVKVRAIKRSRGKMGTRVGFPDPLFQGDTFYAGFLEFGFKHYRGPLVYGDSFLRRPLYENEPRIRSYVMVGLRSYVKEMNR